MTKIYRETFEQGPGGWYGWDSNFAGDKPLELDEGCVISRSPWWIDYNHAPPGAGYMHLLFMLDTQRAPSERHMAIAGDNHFVEHGFGTNFVDAELTLRLKGELISHDTELLLLCQGVHDDLCSGWLLTGQPFTVTDDWSESTVHARLDSDQWTCLAAVTIEWRPTATAPWKPCWPTSTPTSSWSCFRWTLRPWDHSMTTRTACGPRWTTPSGAAGCRKATSAWTRSA